MGVDQLHKDELSELAKTMLDELSEKAQSIRIFGAYSNHLDDEFLNELRYFNSLKRRISNEYVYVYLSSFKLDRFSDAAERLLDQGASSYGIGNEELLEFVEELKKASGDV